MFVRFLVGFITILCIGNYFRAKREQERQRQGRMAKLAASGINSSPNFLGSMSGPPCSNFASGSANVMFS